MKDLRQKTITGVYWSILSKWGQTLLNIGITIILVRLLSPREFGLIAMITVITGFADVFTELGFSAALIQKQDVQSEHFSSIFWINVASGLLFAVAFMIGAPLIANFYNEPLLVPLTMFVSINFLIKSLNIVQNAIILKSLNFRMLSIVEMISIGIAGLIAIIMAFMGFGVWSLVVQWITGSMITTVLIWKLSDWRPDFTFSRIAVKDLLRFSVNLLGARALNYWFRKFDNLLIGRFIGTAELGIYSRAYQLLLFPLQNIAQVIIRVLFPSFSIIHQDKAKVKYLFLKAVGVIALFIYPMSLGLLVTTEPLVMTFFGAQWIRMIPILRIFCLLVLLQSITFPGVLYMSQGRTDLQFKVNIFTGSMIILGITVGLYWGIIGVSIGYGIAIAINFYPNVFYSGKLINLSFWKFLQNFSGILGCSIAMAFFVWALGLILPADWPYWTYLTAQVPFGIIVYGVLIHSFHLKAYKEVRELLYEQTQQIRSGK